jgi:hypothetical protein
MKHKICIFASLLFPLASIAEEKATLIFEDDFEREEEDNSKEEIGRAGRRTVRNEQKETSKSI